MREAEPNGQSRSPTEGNPPAAPSHHTAFWLMDSGKLWGFDVPKVYN